MNGNPIGTLCVITGGPRKGHICEVIGEPGLRWLMTGSRPEAVRRCWTQVVRPISYTTDTPTIRHGQEITNLKPLKGDPDEVIEEEACETS